MDLDPGKESRSLRRLLILCTCLALAASDQAPLAAQESGIVVVSGGLFDVSDKQDVPELGLEWRSRPQLWRLQLNVGAMANADSGGYLFAGLRRDFFFSERWGVSIGLAGGGYTAGDGLDLGGTFQFRSSIELFREQGVRSRFGLGFYHLSHSGIYGDVNPGANSAVLVYGFRPRQAN